MRKSNGHGNGGGAGIGADLRASIIADAALRGASPEAIAALSHTLGYSVGETKAAAATAVSSSPSAPVALAAWVAEAKANLDLTPAPAASAKGTEKSERAVRSWQGPYDAGVSDAGYPKVMIRTVTKTGAPFNLTIPLDAFLAIRNGLLAKPSLS